MRSWRPVSMSFRQMAEMGLLLSPRRRAGDAHRRQVDRGEGGGLLPKDGGIAFQHNDLEVWESIRELDFYMKRYELFRIPIPAKVMSKI